MNRNDESRRRTLLIGTTFLAAVTLVSTAPARASGIATGLAAAAAAPKAPPAAQSAAGAQGAGAQVDASGPGQLIQTAATAMLQQLDAHRAEYRKDPAKLHELVDSILLPHFDTDYSARLVLGRHWNTATEEQRKRFVQAFYKSMLANYGDALLDFTADRLKVLPYNGDANAQNANVRTQVRKADGSQVAVNYSVHKTDQGWKAWDVIIEGISYVKSFRDDFGSEIDQKGLDAVIQRLESGEAPTAIKNAGKS
jgi:phospholipid transport system substrate-binding protein